MRMTGKKRLFQKMFFNQLDLTGVKYANLNSKGKIVCFRDNGHGVLMLYKKMDGFTERFEGLWATIRWHL